MRVFPAGWEEGIALLNYRQIAAGISEKGTQLTSDAAASYSYDANGNRNSTGYTTGAGNQTTNDGTFTYTYDAAGELTKKSKGASLETWTYGYDNQNHLIWVEKRASDGGTLQLREDIKYDALGNRLEVALDSNGDGTVDTDTKFGYDGNNVIVDLDGLNSNALLTRRLFGVGVDTPVARVSAAGAVAWYLTDNQNSVTVLVDGTGASLGKISYDGFGNIVTDTTGASGDRFKYTGREWDSAIKLQYNRARYYDPKIGKWTSMDPLGFDAGDANLYRYCGNQPTNGIDPTGYDDKPAALKALELYRPPVLATTPPTFGVPPITVQGSGPSASMIIGKGTITTILDLPTKPLPGVTIKNPLVFPIFGGTFEYSQTPPKVTFGKGGLILQKGGGTQFKWTIKF